MQMVHMDSGVQSTTHQCLTSSPDHETPTHGVKSLSSCQLWQTIFARLICCLIRTESGSHHEQVQVHETEIAMGTPCHVRESSTGGNSPTSSVMSARRPLSSSFKDGGQEKAACDVACDVT